VILLSGYVVAYTARYLALATTVPVGRMLRAVLDALIAAFAGELAPLEPRERMQVYEARARVYLTVLADAERAQAVIREAVTGFASRWLDPPAMERVSRLLALDAALCPRYGDAHEFGCALDFDARAVLEALGGMRAPSPEAFDGHPRRLRFASPGGLDVVLKSPDGGNWLQSRLLDDAECALRPAEGGQLVFNAHVS